MVQSSYVGDDGIVRYSTKARCRRHLKNLSRFGLKLSDLDTWSTFNSPAFFCEKVIDYVPPSLIGLDDESTFETHMRSFKKNRQSAVGTARSLVEKLVEEGKIMPYVDMVPTRVLNNVQPERKTHSGQSTGKVEMLATAQRFNDPQSKILMEVVAPWIQRTLLSRQSPIDIIPRTLCGRGLYQGRADVDFFKKRVPPSLAVGAYLASIAWRSNTDKWLLKPSSISGNVDPLKGLEERKLTSVEKKFLFVYTLTREGFHKHHDRSMSRRLPLEVILDLYEGLESDGHLLEEIPPEIPWWEIRNKYVSLQEFYKEFIAAYDEAAWYAGLDSDPGMETAGHVKEVSEVTYLKDKMLSYALPDYGEEKVYESMARHASFERTKDIARRYLTLDSVVKAWIPVQVFREIRRGWLKTNTNLINKIHDMRSPDRDPEKQKIIHQILRNISDVLMKERDVRMQRHIEQSFITIEEQIDQKLSENISSPEFNPEEKQAEPVQAEVVKPVRQPDPVRKLSTPVPASRINSRVLNHESSTRDGVRLDDYTFIDVDSMANIVIGSPYRQVLLRTEDGTVLGLASTVGHVNLRIPLEQQGLPLRGKFMLFKGGFLHKDLMSLSKYKASRLNFFNLKSPQDLNLWVEHPARLAPHLLLTDKDSVFFNSIMMRQRYEYPRLGHHSDDLEISFAESASLARFSEKRRKLTAVTGESRPEIRF